MVVSTATHGRSLHVEGFRDPLAADPKALVSQAGLDPEKADLHLAPYYSLDDTMVARRAEKMLHPPSTVKLDARQGELVAEGSAPQQWITRLEERATLIPGVTGLDESHLVNSNLQQLFNIKNSVESVILLFPLGRAEMEPARIKKSPRSKRGCANSNPRPMLFISP